jgi:hypothetical protein
LFAFDGVIPNSAPCATCRLATLLAEQVYRGNMTGADAAAELQSRAEAEWAAQGLS